MRLKKYVMKSFIRYYLGGQIREDLMDGTWFRASVQKNAVGNREGKRPRERPRHSCEDNIKMKLNEIGFGNVDMVRLG
jgi:hypothetical protein